LTTTTTLKTAATKTITIALKTTSNSTAIKEKLYNAKNKAITATSKDRTDSNIMQTTSIADRHDRSKNVIFFNCPFF
jgi:hypothetical protein